jgi:hypothetical protein
MPHGACRRPQLGFSCMSTVAGAHHCCPVASLMHVQVRWWTGCGWPHFKTAWGRPLTPRAAAQPQAAPGVVGVVALSSCSSSSTSGSRGALRLATAAASLSKCHRRRLVYSARQRWTWSGCGRRGARRRHRPY